jgi:hypothetical protein
MRDLSLPVFEPYRIRSEAMREWFFGVPESTGGAFQLPSGLRHGSYKVSHSLRVLAASGGGWDHLSVSCRNRCPTWDEMMLVHRMFFEPTEISAQYCMPASDHVNVHPYVLHLWRPLDAVFPVPPPEFV